MLMLNPVWIRSFAMLVQEGSFTRAADRLDLTQAAISQHGRHLEDRIGPVLLRGPRRFELTPAGQALIDHAAELETAERRLQARLSEGEAATGPLSIITPGSIGQFLYPRLLDLQADTPGLTVHHRFAPDPDIIAAVAENRAELGMVTHPPEDPRLTHQLFTRESLELIVPAGKAAEGWDDLMRIGFIDHPDGKAMATRLLTQRFAGNPGVGHLPVRGFVNQIGLIAEPVARGLGFTVLPRHARLAFGRQDAIAVVAGDPVRDRLWLIHRAEWPLSARAQRAIEHMRAVLGESDATG